MTAGDIFMAVAWFASGWMAHTAYRAWIDGQEDDE